MTFHPDPWLPWSENSAHFNIPYSSKVAANFPLDITKGKNWHRSLKTAQPDVMAPFVRLQHPLGRMPGCQYWYREPKPRSNYGTSWPSGHDPSFEGFFHSPSTLHTSFFVLSTFRVYRESQTDQQLNYHRER